VALHHGYRLCDYDFRVGSHCFRSPTHRRAGAADGIFSLPMVTLDSASAFGGAPISIILESDSSLRWHVCRFAHELPDRVENDLELRIIVLLETFQSAGQLCI
jgi:hypothetical protein